MADTVNRLMNVGFVWLLVAFCGCSSMHHEATIQVVKRTPYFSGYKYHCRDMVAAVNALRRSGKPKALGTLREYAVSHEKDQRQEERVALICSLLFINPDGWGKIPRGAPGPDVNWEFAQANYPLFPLALSRGVPFLLVSGYTVAALGPSGNESLRYIAKCENLRMITHDLPARGFERAAEDLVDSPEFRKLYSNSGGMLEDMKEMILEQASPYNYNY